jgi:formylglycine-generating enzyme required for sulfatase activity
MVDGGLRSKPGLPLAKLVLLAVTVCGLAAANSSWFGTSDSQTPDKGAGFQDCPECPQMVVIPAGSFLMGSAEGQGSHDEYPQHEVTIAEPFAVGRFEVTFAQWDACRADGGCTLDPEDNGWGRGTRPVTNISWDDTREYLAWLSKRTRKTYRLLSEAEWEYAARAGSGTAYSWGDAIGANNANCRDCGSAWDHRQTAPVGSFKPNAFGLLDIHGNVLEWCEDAWHDTYDGAPSDGSVFAGGDVGFRVLRGGSWVTLSDLIRSAYRDKSQPFDRSYVAGFRVARPLGQ